MSSMTVTRIWAISLAMNVSTSPSGENIVITAYTIIATDFEQAMAKLHEQFVNGAFLVPRGFDLTAIKAEYSKEAVERAAKKYSWTTKKLSANKYELTRRTY